MAKKQSSPRMSQKAARVLSTGKASKETLLSLAGSVLSQDEIRGNRAKARKKSQ